MWLNTTLTVCVKILSVCPIELSIQWRRKCQTYPCEDDATDLQHGHVGLFAVALLPEDGAHAVFGRVARLQPRQIILLGGGQKSVCRVSVCFWAGHIQHLEGRHLSPCPLSNSALFTVHTIYSLYIVNLIL